MQPDLEAHLVNSLQYPADVRCLFNSSEVLAISQRVRSFENSIEENCAGFVRMNAPERYARQRLRKRDSALNIVCSHRSSSCTGFAVVSIAFHSLTGSRTDTP
jgi:hypothetical protein